MEKLFLKVNRQLDKIGYNMGLRMADDLLAKNPKIGKCSEMQQIAEIISKNALKCYLGVGSQVIAGGSSANEFSIVLDSNPLVEFVVGFVCFPRFRGDLLFGTLTVQLIICINPLS